MQISETPKLSRKTMLDSKNTNESIKNIKTAKFSQDESRKIEKMI